MRFFPIATVLPTAIGDTIASLPVFKYVKDKYPGMQYYLFLWPQTYALVEQLFKENDLLGHNIHLVPIDDAADFSIKKSKLETELNTKFAGRTYNGQEHVTNLHRHMTEQAFMTLLDQSILDLKPYDMEYLQVDKKGFCEQLGPFMGERYLALVATNQYPVRAMAPSIYELLIKEAARRKLKILWIGAGEVPQEIKDLMQPEHVDLTNKTATTLDLLEVLRDVRVYGVATPDGGISHVAASVRDLSVFCYYTTVIPKHRVPINHKLFYGVLSNVNCAGCQTNYKFAYDCDYRTCIERPEETLKPLCARTTSPLDLKGYAELKNFVDSLC